MNLLQVRLGQIPIDPATGALVSGGITEQVAQVLSNIGAVLTSLDRNFSHVVKTTIFLKDLNDFAAVNEGYGKALGDEKPARSTIQVARLPLDSLVEIEMIVAMS